MEVSAVPPEWLSYLGKFGIPSIVIVAAYWALPKVWSFISSRIGIASQTNDLTNAGLGGVTDVISTLRGQILDLSNQFKDVEQKLKDMSSTLDQAVQDKVMAQNEAAKAKSDLYILQLYVERLRAQLTSIGVTPVPLPQ